MPSTTTAPPSSPTDRTGQPAPPVLADPARRPAVPGVVLRALLLGAASGSRSTYGLAAVALTTPAPVAATPVPEHALGSRGGRIAAALAALGESVGDQLPQAPSRLDPPGLPARILTGAASGALIGRRHAASPGLTGGLAAVAALAAVGAAVAGSRFRAAASARLGRDTWGALVEDLAAAGLALAGARGGAAPTAVTPRR